MKKLRIVFSLVFVIAVIAAGVFVWARSELAKSLPEVSGTITLQGLSSQVDVYRDVYGIPHIYARNRNDLMFAMGYVCAQDRLWQMDLTRRAATGRLAEIFGESVIGTDLLTRTVGLKRVAELQLEKTSPGTAAVLKAYADGVNRCIEQLDTLPPEFRLLKYRPEPWQVTDSLAISRLLAWQLSMNFRAEIILQKLATKLGNEKVAELGPSYPAEGPFIIQPPAIVLPAEIIEESMGHTLPETGMSLLDDIIGTSGGSNSWVIGPSRSKSGAPILANDPHLSGTRMPSIWYYVHLVGGGFDVIGGVAPGLPAPILGHNRSIGWGMTNMTADVQDVYIERLNLDNPYQYEYDGEWVDMDARTERIYFRTEDGEQAFIEKEIRSTVHGPLINEVAPGVVYAVSLKWTGFEPTLDHEALFDLNLANDWTDFCEALRNLQVAPQNLIYADIEGNIGYYAAGAIPIRSSGNGTTPQKGWSSDTAWKGTIPFKEMPRVFNPSDGYIVTANNRVVGDEYEHFISAYWAPRFRYERIAELIEQEEKHDTASVARGQADSKSLFAKLLLETLMPALESATEPAQREALDYLREWDFDSTTDSVAATIYHEFLIQFAKNTFVDEMGVTLAREYLDNYYLWVERFVLFVQEGSQWFDIARTEQIETRDDIARLSFEKAVNSLQRRLGTDMSQWKWGSVHKVEFRHPLERNRVAKLLFNLGPFSFPGDGESVNRGTFDFNDPYGVTMAASLRHIMDFSRLNQTLAVHTTGQSGNPVSAHYRDLADKWLNGEYIIMMMDKDDFVGNADGYLKLIPAGSGGGSSATKQKL